MNKVTLDCLNIIFLMENRCLWQSGVGEKKLTPQLGNEPGTSRLSFKCSTKLSYQGIHALPPNKSPSGDYICFVHQAFRLMTCRPVVEDFVFNEQGYSRLLEHNFFLMKNRCLWQSGVGEKKNQLLSWETNLGPLN